MSERDEKRGSGAGCAILAVVGLFLIPVLYMLSVGPVVRLANVYPALESLGYIYVPLVFAAESCEPLERVLNWYIDLWL